jgi:hypothetical protein
MAASLFAERIEMNDTEMIECLLSALEYHTEQTRPIHFTKTAVEAAREHLRNPPMVNLDTASGFTFSDGTGTFIGAVQMLKWLVEHHSGDYWAHMAKRNEEAAR